MVCFEITIRQIYWKYPSAGIGRTGTFIALDYLLDEGAAMESVDVINCVSKLRQQRAHSIQTKVSQKSKPQPQSIIFKKKTKLNSMFTFILTYSTGAVYIPLWRTCTRIEKHETKTFMPTYGWNINQHMFKIILFHIASLTV